MRVCAALVQAKAGEGTGDGLCEHRDNLIVALGFSVSCVIPGAFVVLQDPEKNWTRGQAWVENGG